jgi:hypothetical protein
MYWMEINLSSKTDWTLNTFKETRLGLKTDATVKKCEKSERISKKQNLPLETQRLGKMFNNFSKDQVMIVVIQVWNEK